MNGKITSPNAHIGVLERRRNHLVSRLRGGRDYRSSTAANFDRAEIEALEAAVSALRQHVSPTSPLVALEGLVRAIVEDVEDREYEGTLNSAQAVLAAHGIQ